MTGLLFIGRRPSALKFAIPFFICFLPGLLSEAESPSGLGRLSVYRGREVRGAASSGLLEPPLGTPTSGFGVLGSRPDRAPPSAGP